MEFYSLTVRKSLFLFLKSPHIRLFIGFENKDFFQTVKVCMVLFAFLI